MTFKIGSPNENETYTSTCFLIADSWDDWFKFNTLYRLVIFTENSERYDAGEVKIGLKDFKFGRPPIDNTFEVLGEQYFSLGQNENYYEVIYSLSIRDKEEILIGLRDCAYDLNRLNKNKDEDIMKTSLLRFVTIDTVKNKFNKIINGNANLTGFNFNYKYPQAKTTGEPLLLDFRVEPNSLPPTNIHVIIGRNGVGKTTLFRNMTLALKGDEAHEVGVFNVQSEEGDTKFTNLVSISFSAFDSFEPLPDGELGKSKIKYNYVGIQKNKIIDKETGEEIRRPPKTAEELTYEFVSSLKKCSTGPRKERWENVIDILSYDRLFFQANILELINSEKEHVKKTFDKLSSGHKIVLLTLTRLIELVDEKTLVFLDEPESHLHPPLFSAFTRALSFLLLKRNGVALIATHSPVVLQEIPKKCAWIISRYKSKVSKSRPTLETFGENVGILTREVFGLEVTHSGFHKLLEDEVAKLDTYDQLVDKFNGCLGNEALSLVKSMFYYKE